MKKQPLVILSVLTLTLSSPVIFAEPATEAEAAIEPDVVTEIDSAAEPEVIKQNEVTSDSINTDTTPSEQIQANEVESINETPEARSTENQVVIDGLPENGIVPPAESEMKPDSTMKIQEQAADEASTEVNTPMEQNILNTRVDNRYTFKVGLSALRFFYQEFDSNDNVVDDEIGIIPGIQFGVSYIEDNHFVELDFNFISGQVDYSGHTVSSNPVLNNLPISSRTETDITDIRLLLGQNYVTDSMRKYSLYAGLGYYHWRRHISPTTTSTGVGVAGILEFYSWGYAVLGARFPIIVDNQTDAHLDVSLTRMFMAKLDVDFLGFQNYDTMKLDLAEKWGLRLAMPWKLSTQHDYSVTVEPYFVLWDIGRSNTQEATVNGTGSGTSFVEPRSETRNLGVSVYLKF
ncbi:MAG: hypothetical protein OQK73_08375 [Gammaproteobacteria bacterium]|nr:hypothetical protein [Gammaproteobacteria bacterium]